MIFSWLRLASFPPSLFYIAYPIAPGRKSGAARIKRQSAKSRNRKIHHG